MSVSNAPQPLEVARSWAASFLRDPLTLPFSFLYDGKLIRGIPLTWQPRREERRIDANIVETWFSGEDPFSGLKVSLDILEYLDFPVVEWTVLLDQKGMQSSALVEDLRALDLDFEGDYRDVWSCNGDFYNIAGYSPSLRRLDEGEKLRFAPDGGRPSDQAFPYFRVSGEKSGFSLAVGWPGQWAAAFEKTETGMHIQAGQELTRFRMEGGEKVRSPRITMLAWEGGQAEAINAWRRWYMAHILPKPDGRMLQPRLTCASTEGGEEFTNASEQNQLRLLRKARAHGLDFDTWWIDAGWYPCLYKENKKTWWHTGNWRPDADRFPDGFGPVGSALHQLGTELLVWFEPERVHHDTELDKEHPEWLLYMKKPDGTLDDNRLLNLGIPACREWLTARVSGIIREGGINIYRQDFNFAPLEFWRQNDAPDRQGLNENFHVQGYLQYWDDLLREHPGLWIDSCSSGGRRNDLSTMRRAVPLHYTDYGYGDPAVKLAFHRTLFEWIPYFKESTITWDDLKEGVDKRFDDALSSFGFHLAFAGMLFISIDLNRDDYNYELARRMAAVWRRASQYLYGDYYQLTPFHKRENEWVAWQFDRPEKDDGVVQTIRLGECEQETITVQLQGLQAEADYELENPETAETRQAQGAELMRGYTFAQPRRSGAFWFYRKLDS